MSDILQQVAAYHPGPNLDIIKKAYVYSAKVHRGQLRQSGEPYLTHPLAVAGLLAKLRLDEATIVAGMLHDTIEDTLATAEEIKELFGDEVGLIVEGVTKLSRLSALHVLSQEEKQAENFRKMLLAMAQDIRVILVKLADRIHNMRTLHHMNGEKQARIAQETLDIYAPLANRLGIGIMKNELEDLSFRYLKPRDFAELELRITQKKKEREKYLKDVVSLIQSKLTGVAITANVAGRFKHYYGIYKKMRSHSIEFEQVPDIIAFQIITHELSHCYEALGLIHQMWKPVPGRIKDYVAIPKANMYQSLHTTVIGPLSERIEIQIQTHDMHRVAEEGIAARWAYQAGKSEFKHDMNQFAWLRQLLEWQQELKDPREFLDTVKVDLFTDEVFVFTPKGDVRSLPRGATPVDFAYAIHSEIGEKCVGAKANGKIVPLRYKLKNGDQVEVLVSPQAHPSKDWLTFVKTSRAQQKIRSFIKQQQREQSLVLGRELTERELKRFGLTLNKLIKSEQLRPHAKALGYPTEEHLMIAVGYGKVQLSDLVERLIPAEKVEAFKDRQQKPSASGLFNSVTEMARKIVNRMSPNSGITINGVDDVLVHFGRCCNPVPGDAIVGFITRGRGVTVHTVMCDKVLATDPERRVNVMWNVRKALRRPVTLRVLTVDRPGLLADMTQIFSDRGVNINQANCRATSDDRAVNTFEVTILDLKQLTDVMHSIEKLIGVHSVERV